MHRRMHIRNDVDVYVCAAHDLNIKQVKMNKSLDMIVSMGTLRRNV